MFTTRKTFLPGIETLEKREMMSASNPTAGAVWTEETGFRGHVAPGRNAVASDFKVEYQWGDGSTTVAKNVVDRGGGQFLAKADHTYDQAGKTPELFKVTITNTRDKITWVQEQHGRTVDPALAAVAQATNQATPVLQGGVSMTAQDARNAIATAANTLDDAVGHIPGLQAMADATKAIADTARDIAYATGIAQTAEVINTVEGGVGALKAIGGVGKIVVENAPKVVQGVKNAGQTLKNAGDAIKNGLPAAPVPSPAKGGVVPTAPKVSGPTAPAADVPDPNGTIHVTFRGDTRAIEDVAGAGGYKPKNLTGSVALEDHVFKADKIPSSFVSTTENLTVAENFASPPPPTQFVGHLTPDQLAGLMKAVEDQMKAQTPHVALIRVDRGVQVNAQIPNNKFAKEMEWALPGGAPLENILGWFPVSPTTHKIDLGGFVANPAFRK